MTAYLFLGGSEDGRWHRADPDCDKTISMPLRPEIRGMDAPEQGPEAPSVKYEVYRRHQWAQYIGDFPMRSMVLRYVYVHESLTDLEALDRLLEGYKPGPVKTAESERALDGLSGPNSVGLSREAALEESVRRVEKAAGEDIRRKLERIMAPDIVGTGQSVDVSYSGGVVAVWRLEEDGRVTEVLPQKLSLGDVNRALDVLEHHRGLMASLMEMAADAAKPCDCGSPRCTYPGSLYCMKDQR